HVRLRVVDAAGGPRCEVREPARCERGARCRGGGAGARRQGVLQRAGARDNGCAACGRGARLPWRGRKEAGGADGCRLQRVAVGDARRAARRVQAGGRRHAVRRLHRGALHGRCGVHAVRLVLLEV
ncbi:ATG8/AUT7/APG8/PAZ2_putative, partial [Leishmania major strain Friedlin]